MNGLATDNDEKEQNHFTAFDDGAVRIAGDAAEFSLMPWFAHRDKIMAAPKRAK